jgi:hypothetical protein
MPRSSCGPLYAACLSLIAAGCTSVSPPPAHTADPDYTAWTCGELAKEAKTLARRTAGTREFLLPQARKDAEEQRKSDKRRLKAAQSAAVDRGC